MDPMSDTSPVPPSQAPKTVGAPFSVTRLVVHFITDGARRLVLVIENDGDGCFRHARLTLLVDQLRQVPATHLPRKIVTKGVGGLWRKILNNFLM